MDWIKVNELVATVVNIVGSFDGKYDIGQAMLYPKKVLILKYNTYTPINNVTSWVLKICITTIIIIIIII